MPLPKIDTPRYEMTIPSTGEKAPYRPYLVKEEKILMMAIESNDDRQMIRAVKDVISGCVEGIDVTSLSMFDLEYIFLMLRSKSVGETATVGLKCSECDVKNDIDINLEEVRVDAPEGSESKIIPLTDAISVRMKYPSVDSLMNANHTNVSENPSIDALFDMLISCIDKIYSGDEVYDAGQQSKDELREFIESLSTKQFSEMQSFIQNAPTAAIDVEFKCAGCGADNNINVRGLGNFFS